MSENTPTTQPEPSPKPSFGERLSSAFVGFVRFLARLVLVVLILGAIAAALYFAVPYLYRQYVQPLHDLQTRVDALEQQSASRAEQVNRQLLALQDDLTRLHEQQQALNQQLGKQQDALDGLQSRLEAVEKQTDALSTQLDALGKRVDAVSDDAAAAQATAEALQTAWQDWEGRLTEMQANLAVLRVMESLTRTRLLIGQGNYGLARDELLGAQATLRWLQQTASTEAYAQAADQVSLAADALPSAPEVALQDLEAAWRLLAETLPQVTATPETTSAGTPTPGAQETPTPTPTPTP